MGNRDPKVTDVHYEKINDYGFLGGRAYRASATLDDGRTGSSTSRIAEDAARGAVNDAKSSK